MLATSALSARSPSGAGTPLYGRNRQRDQLLGGVAVTVIEQLGQVDAELGSVDLHVR